MKIFIFEDVYKLTDAYHAGGALTIVAEDITTAVELAHNYKDRFEGKHIKLTAEEIKKVISYDLLGENIEPKVFVFSDSGCC